MSELIEFKKIIVPPPYKHIFARLGFTKGRTSLGDGKREQIMASIDGFFGAVKLRGSAKRLDIISAKDGVVLFEDNVTVKSRSIAKYLKDATSAVFLGVTCGKRLGVRINTLIKKGDIASAAIADAVGSEAADAGLDWMMQYLTRHFRRQNIILFNNRFSPGYGDFELKDQKQFFDLLKLKRLGMTLSKSFLLIPEKSVTAIAGVRALAA